MTGEQDLKKLAAESVKTDLGILITAKEEAKRNVMGDPSPANLAAFDKATKMLAENLEADKEPVFENRVEVLNHLKRKGYAVQKSKLYADSKKGLLKLQDDKTILESDVKAYVRRSGLVKPSDLAAADPTKDDALILKRREMEIKKLEEQVAELEFKREVSQGLYILKTDFELEIAARIAVFDANLRHFFQSRISDWVSQAEGNLKKIPVLLESINQHLDEQFNEFASMKTFQVIIVENENSAEQN
jgi:hypothetical protein